MQIYSSNGPMQLSPQSTVNGIYSSHNETPLKEDHQDDCDDNAPSYCLVYLANIANVVK